MRRTKIVCTIGPATSSGERLEQLIRAGMNVARLNFSHGTQEEHAQVIEHIRSISARLGRSIALLQDLQGPKIRTGRLQGKQPVQLVEGEFITITTRDIIGNAERVSTTYKQLPQDVKPGDRILLDDGLMELCVIEKSDEDIRCQIIHGGFLKEHKGINLPGVAVSAPALTEKDRADLRFGISQGVDYVALSFVRRPEDVLEARQLIKQYQEELNRTDQAEPPLIVKLEKPEAVARLDEILEVADGVMVARGDLGVEMSPEKVPLLQKHIIEKCNDLGLPVITATQMLESMVTNPRPTRAEVNDVANAIIDGTDAVMLSAETASGAYPIEAVKMMVRIALETEAGDRTARLPQCQRLTQEHAVSHAARALSEEVSVKAIVVFTRSGATAQLISKDRPRRPIIAYTPNEHVYRQLALWWGVWPYHIGMHGSTEALVDEVSQRLLDDRLVEDGDNVVIMGGFPIASRARTNFVKLHQVEKVPQE
ncbi:pyruvate kinase [Thermosporothrix hazakensis]|jgi:pyruvate kinase|uniref:Pyruvate kinase n=2 Tax=Thermosporothrix TaxID=768650 RepID=A0A326U8M4_THEHA|nr:pyruvate kinase [Thermosporothrix hazakensis]PZW30615.1 pyruvate kinase [Thermosporothrix hazakensis]BBH91330.1 pyruvate kinase [Thermosporothrix sp. COM3]GCE49477.1 pyruvate kinase [Thermosporothrix hazakensis]